MKGHGTQFDRKKDDAIAALLTQRNIEEAAKSVGIVANTLGSWMEVPEFQKAYLKAVRTSSKTEAGAATGPNSSDLWNAAGQRCA
jgi:hypothetical protein